MRFCGYTRRPSQSSARRSKTISRPGLQSLAARSFNRPWVLHRHRRIWRDPEMFEPSRFMPTAPQPSRFAYMPFGVGPRTCIGAQFALTELVLVLSAIARTFRIALAEPRVVNPVGIVSTQPEHPPPFVLRRR